MSLVSDLITDTEQMLRGMYRPTRNRLVTARDSDDVDFTLEFSFAAAIARGTLLVIDDEILYVWETNASTGVVTVERAVEGSVAASHDAGAIIEVNPRFPRPAIRKALQHEIASWPRDVYRPLQTTIAVGATVYSVDLGLTSAEFYDILDVRRRPTDVGDPWRNIHFDLARDSDVSDFASGAGINLLDGIAQDGYINVVYSAPFDTSVFDDDTDLTDDIGLSARMIDIPPYGAVWRLLSGQEVLRTSMEAQGEHRIAEEVPAGSAMRTAAYFKNVRDMRLSEEAVYLLGNHLWRTVG